MFGISKDEILDDFLWENDLPEVDGQELQEVKRRLRERYYDFNSFDIDLQARLIKEELWDE